MDSEPELFLMVVARCKLTAQFQYPDIKHLKPYLPDPPVGTNAILGSFPLFSLFKLGKLAGGGMRRTLPTLPKLCNPCCRVTEKKIKSSNIYIYIYIYINIGTDKQKF